MKKNNKIDYDDLFPSISAIEIQKPIVDQETVELDYLLHSINVRQSHKEIETLAAGWDKLVVSALAIAGNVDPFQSALPIGSEVPAVEAVNWKPGDRHCDIRPRLIDKSTGKARMIDSGSQITITSKRPEDKIDDSFKLVAVNGSRIDTYGVRDIEVKIGRKAYSMPAVVCDIRQDILGMDFIT